MTPEEIAAQLTDDISVNSGLSNNVKAELPHGCRRKSNSVPQALMEDDIADMAEIVERVSKIVLPRLQIPDARLSYNSAPTRIPLYESNSRRVQRVVSLSSGVRVTSEVVRTRASRSVQTNRPISGNELGSRSLTI